MSSQALINYANFAANQELSRNIFQSEQERQNKDEEKSSEEAQQQTLEMLGLHFFGEKIKDYLAEKLSKATGIDKDTIKEVAKDPKAAVKNAVEQGKTKAEAELNKARTSIEEQAEARGLSPDGILNRTRLPTAEEIDRIREGAAPGEEEQRTSEEVEAAEADDTAPDAPPPPTTEEPAETDTAGAEPAAPTEEPAAPPPPEPVNIMDEPVPEQVSAPALEPAAPEPAPAPAPEPVAEAAPTAVETISSRIPTGGVAMPGREEMTQILAQRAQDPSETLINDIQAHMRQYGENDIADRISNNTTRQGEVEAKLQQQADSIFERPSTLSDDAQTLIDRASQLQQAPQAAQPPPQAAPPEPVAPPPAPVEPAPVPVEDPNISVSDVQDLDSDLFF